MNNREIFQLINQLEEKQEKIDELTDELHEVTQQRNDFRDWYLQAKKNKRWNLT